MSSELASLMSHLGAALGLGLSCAGSSYATFKSSVAVSTIAAKYPGYAMRCFVPVVVAGVLAIYGLVQALLIVAVDVDGGNLGTGYALLGAGLGCGLACLASGVAIGKTAEAGISNFIMALERCDAAPSDPEGATGSAGGTAAPLLEQCTPSDVSKAPGSVFLSMCLNLVYSEAIGLYGLIVGIVIVAMCK